MKFFIINIILILYALTWVKAQEESTTENSEIILTPGPIRGEYLKEDFKTFYDRFSVKILCYGTTCASTSKSVVIKDRVITISKAGTYVLNGNFNGQVYISATKKDFIHLVLKNMTITSDFGPAIYDAKCSKLVITSIGKNKLVDSTNYPISEEEEEEEDKNNNNTEDSDPRKKSPNACLFANSDLTFNGRGSISITGNYFEGIRCKKNLKFISGIIDVKAVEKGIKAKDSISIKGGMINVDSVNSSIVVTKDTDPKKGFVVIDGGIITVKSGNDGIHAETHLSINGGFIDVTEAKEGLEGQMIDIVAGEIHINADDDGINASKIGAKSTDENQTFLLDEFTGNPNDDESSHMQESSTHDSNESTAFITKTAFVATSTASLETLSPTNTDSDFDAGVNCNSEVNNVIMTSESKNYDDDDKVYIRITGGRVYVKVAGNDTDGIDSNGSLYIGGKATVFVSHDTGDIYGNLAALDAEGSNIIDNGATVVATASRMPPPPPDDLFGPISMEGPGGPGGPGGPEGPEGPCGGNGSPSLTEAGTVKQANIRAIVNLQEAGTKVTVKDSKGKIIISHRPETSYSEILISTPKLIEGATYTVIAGTETITSIATISE